MKSTAPNERKPRKVTQHPLLRIRHCLENVKCSAMFTNTMLARTLSLRRLLRIFAFVATMILAVLLHLLIFHLLTASDVPTPPRMDAKQLASPHKDAKQLASPHKDTEYRVSYIDACPDLGFFFKREATANSLFPDACYLCFCQGDHTAVCWKRDNRKCNDESFHYHGIGKRDKRSPGFTDIFFRDASRDVFNKNSKTQCKPYESSFSDDCPPADWCVGCTVCDCDANGRWDCHLLSFCPDGQKKKSNNKKPPPVPDEWLQFMEKTNEKINNGKKTPKRSKTIKSKNYKTKVSNNKSKPVPRGGHKKPPQPKRIVKKNVPLKAGMRQQPGKMKTPIKYRKMAHNKVTPSKKTIKKNIATRKPIQIKNKSTKNNLESQLAHNLMKHVMQNLRRHISTEMKDMTEITKQNANNVKNQKAKTKVNQTKNQPKTVQKRQVKKTNPKPPMQKTREPMKKSIYRAKGKTTNKPGDGKYVRNKREVTMNENTTLSTNAFQDNYKEATNTTMALNVIPITGNPLVPDDGILKDALGSERSTIPPDNTYYKYTVSSEESRTPITIIDVPIKETVTTQFNKTETAFDLISPPHAPITLYLSTEKRQVKDDDADKSTNFPEINPEENELKYSKWYKVKIFKEKTLVSDSDIKHKRIMKLMQPTDKLILIENKNRSRGKSIERKMSYKKYNMVKLLNHSKCKFEDCKMNNSIHNQTTPTNIKSDLYGSLTNIFNYHKNDKSYPLKRKTKISVLKYLKGIFKKIYKGRKTPVGMNRRQLIETLCENFGPCLKMNRKEKVLLNSKLTELNRETAKILKIVKIIKGLLKFLSVPMRNHSDISKQEHIRNDVQILKQILKGRYRKLNGNATLTATEKTQVEYIIGSTKDFIKLVGKFGSLLDDIIIILTKEATSHSKNKVNNYFKNKDLSKDLDPFESLKNLLLRYNLVENSFMKQMYQQLINFENKFNVKPKVSEVKNMNHNVEIENISRNIIHNLRKLKRLAQTVSYRGRGTGGKGRTKRNIDEEDDSIEYLLMMMEYLIKQNHPLNAEPVNDGIDLLIDAIKNAPDIKPIKKKVLEFIPADISDTIITLSTPPSRTENTQSEDDSPSQHGKMSSSEDSSKFKPEDNPSKLIENKDFVNIAEDEKEYEDKFQFDSKAEPEKADVITGMSFFNNLQRQDGIIEEAESIIETSTSISTVKPLNRDTNDKLVSRNHLNVGKTLVRGKNHLDRAVDNSETARKKNKVFSEDMDEENILTSTIATESDLPNPLITEFQTRRVETQKSKIKLKNLEMSDSEKSKLEWIEDNFGKETEKGYVDLEENKSTLGVTSATAKAKTSETLSKIDVTGVSREKGEVKERSGEVKEKNGEVKERNGEIEKYDVTENKKTATKLSAEEIMFRKQMELLNSLDYGTEKAEVFDVDVRDSNVDERYSGDSFS